MFHVFMTSNCLGSILGLANSLRAFSSTMCRNCGLLSECLRISSAHPRLLPSPAATGIVKQLSLRGDAHMGWQRLWGRKEEKRERH